MNDFTLLELQVIEMITELKLNPGITEKKVERELRKHYSNTLLKGLFQKLQISRIARENT